ncbi:unnamed protein product [Protopolystoma xenopodis]|uniref:Ig-like domain-containing protein n=1 Tax=Protopolystoma xenopodis TaxID=117903 RepID=A0A448WZR5_9PLAT|nr:unnamed protein product [Protopolystoma xenopodis]
MALPPIVTQRLQPQTSVPEGGEVCLDCQFGGVPEPIVSWFKDGVKIHSNPDFQYAMLDRLHFLNQGEQEEVTRMGSRSDYAFLAQRFFYRTPKRLSRGYRQKHCASIINLQQTKMN